MISARIASDDSEAFRSGRPTVEKLARTELTIGTADGEAAAAHAVLSDGSEIVVPLAGLVDLERECARLRGELSQLERHLLSLEQRLANERFTSQAPANVVAAERQKQQEWSARRAQLARKVEELCAG
jgi:valyl-tRNA synthetase